MDILLYLKNVRFRVNWHPIEYRLFEDKEIFLKRISKDCLYRNDWSVFEYQFGELEYRSVRFETEILRDDNYQGSAVINYTDSETPYTRIMEWKHFDQNADEGYTIVTKEFPQEWNRSKEAYYPINDTKNSDIFKNTLEKLEIVIMLSLVED